MFEFIGFLFLLLVCYVFIRVMVISGVWKQAEGVAYPVG